MRDAQCLDESQRRFSNHCLEDALLRAGLATHVNACTDAETFVASNVIVSAFTSAGSSWLSEPSRKATPVFALDHLSRPHTGIDPYALCASQMRWHCHIFGRPVRRPDAYWICGTGMGRSGTACTDLSISTFVNDRSTERIVMSPKASLRILGISGSLRKASFNAAALRAVAALLPEGMSFETASLEAIPFYNADVEAEGFPAPVIQLRHEVAEADALVFAVPEYNFSVSGVLKNALEWLSRPPDPPAYGKPCAMFGASVSPLGTARGQFHLRHICVSLNMISVNTPHVDIASASGKVDGDGVLVDPSALDQLRQLMDELERLTTLIRSRAAQNR